MWGRDDNKKGGKHRKSCFCKFFGCDCFVVSKTYAYLLSINLFPEVRGGILINSLRALMFMKIYGKERNLCSLAGGVDKKAF